MRSLPVGMTALTLLALSPDAADGQTYPIELGIDAAVTVRLDEPRVTTLTIPIQRFRAGFFTSPTLSIEPSFALNYSRVQGGGSFSSMALTVGALFHLSPDRMRDQVYLRPFVGFTRFSNGASDADPHLGFGAGIKFPWANRRLATRVEAFLQHVFAEPEDASFLGVLFGLSFFTR